MQSRHLSLCIPTALAVFALLLAPASAARCQEAYNLKRVYKAGDSDRYRVTTAIVGEGLTATTKLVVRERVQEVKLDGTAIVVATVESAAMEVNGQAVPFPHTGQTVTSTIDKSGKVIKREGGSSGIVDMPGYGGSGLPDRPLKIGEVLSIAVPQGEGKDAGSATMTVTVAGKEKAGADLSVDTVKLKTSMARPMLAPGGSQPFTVTGTAYIEPGTGRVLKMEGSVTGVLPAPIGKGTITFTRVRIGEHDTFDDKPAAKSGAAK